MMNKTDYGCELQIIISNGMQNMIYKEIEVKLLENLLVFKSFLHQNFKKYEHYENII